MEPGRVCPGASEQNDGWSFEKEKQVILTVTQTKYLALTERTNHSARITVMPSYTDAPPTAQAPGDLDVSYGNAGYQLVNPAGIELYEARGMRLTDNNETLIAGAAPDILPTHTRTQFILMRRDENGALVEGFGTLGMACGHFKPDEPAWGSYGAKIFPLRDSRWLLLGFVHNHANMRMPSLAWLHDDGRADTDSGNNGTFVLTSPLPGESASPGTPLVDGDTQSTGFIVTLFQYVDELDYWGSLLSRIEPNGELDITFNQGKQYAETHTRGGETYDPTALGHQVDDRILVVGNTDDKRGIKGGLIKRFDNNGGLDTTFANNGEYRTQNQRYAHLVCNEESILVCGATSQGALMVKLHADGTPHPDFGGLPVITPQVTAWHKVLIHEGKVIAIGVVDGGFSSQAVLARFERSGEPDITFGASKNGRVTLEFGGQFNTVIDLAIDQQERILVLGSAKGSFGAVNFYIARVFS
ncbi:hypothetical protein FFI16_002005 [Pseudomonas sp. KBS0710]|nr:hypothetical protein FFI16_002005 [Pseudomonas sp. KBS0710]